MVWAHSFDWHRLGFPGNKGVGLLFISNQSYARVIKMLDPYQKAFTAPPLLDGVAWGQRFLPYAWGNSLPISGSSAAIHNIVM
jgi:hypothetical protein